jgi:pyridoxal phosphate enzyme (YggS family)
MSVRLLDNLARVRERIAAAAKRSGRQAGDVKLVGVTKYVTAELARALAHAGCLDLGESRPQELWSKAQALSDLPVHWHVIGHLQRNKVPRTVAVASLIHSADSLRLIETIEAEAARQGRVLPILLEVNISGDEAKHGLHPSELPALLPTLATYRNVKVQGLMAMSGLESGPDDTRREFASLRQLRDQLCADSPAGLHWDQLSMGMSDDFETAIEEGATLVRVGSALFEGVA